MQSVPFARILLAGLMVGLLDAFFAVMVCVTAGTGCVPIRVFWSIAAGILGREAAIAGGVPTALLGVGLHFSIATIWASIYWVAYQRLGALRRAVTTLGGAIAVAILFGFVVYGVMNFAVPLVSYARSTPITSRFFWIILLGHPIFVAAPIVWLVRSPTARYVPA
jgi:hypothetical protein